MDGILLLNKEVGITSYDVIRQIKRVLSRKVKIGHAGTLDPFAQGLLIILLGRATKLQDRIHELKKTYEVDAEFGFETDTQDITGKIIETSSAPSKEELEGVLDSFKGEITQYPPRYSAVKIDGKRAYDLARKEIDFETKAKNISIYNLTLLNYTPPIGQFSVQCSTGTYVRTLIVDMARAINVRATAKKLLRSEIGPFNVRDAVLISQISEEGLSRSIISLDKLKDLGIER